MRNITNKIHVIVEKVIYDETILVTTAHTKIKQNDWSQEIIWELVSENIVNITDELCHNLKSHPRYDTN